MFLLPCFLDRGALVLFAKGLQLNVF
jgi:hypothetical protein